MKKFHIVLLLFIMISIVSNTGCKEGLGEKKELFGENFLGQKLIFPPNIEEILGEQLTSRKFLLISYIDSSTCTPCYLEKYKLYNTYQNQFENYNVLPVLILQTDEEIEHYEDWLRDISLPFPVLFDIYGEVCGINNLPKDEKYQTFLINKEKKVIWIGSPIQSKKSWELFQKMMRRIK